MRVTVVCVVLALVALAYSQVPQPCAFPGEWSGKIFRSDRIKNFAEEANIFYDAANKRIATYEEIDISRAKDFYHEILLFNEGKRYSINLVTKACIVYDLKDSFRPIHIPENATFEGEFYLGTSSIAGDGVLVESWVGDTTNPRGVYQILVTVNACVPINDLFYDEQTPQLVQTFYYDIVFGIFNPNVFIPPPLSDCKPGI